MWAGGETVQRKTKAERTAEDRVCSWRTTPADAAIYIQEAARIAVKTYDILYADPAWKFEVWDSETGNDRAPPYRTMTVEEMAALPVRQLGAKHSFLCMWVVDSMYPEAMMLANCWEYYFCTVLFRWFKTNGSQLRLFDPTPKPGFSTGHHTRAGACEEVWLFKRGKGLPVLRHDIRREFHAPIREHSQKPDEVRGWITDLYGERDRVELFARTRAPGWDQAISDQADLFPYKTSKL